MVNGDFTAELTAMQPAYYVSNLLSFRTETPQTVLGHLAEHHPHDLTPLQRNAWLSHIGTLQAASRGLAEGWVALEFAIPRMGKRVDAVMIAGGIVFVIEFKVGAEIYSAAAVEQVVDYALDLKNFHAPSHQRHIVPVLVATDAPDNNFELRWDNDCVATPLLCNEQTLILAISTVLCGTPRQEALDGTTWSNGGYRPTPTIIEAAQALYRQHKVEDITRSDSGAKNLTETTRCIADIIEDAKAKNDKAICFVTGVPGAGKTLAGLNLVTERTVAHKDEHAVFLSGNGPLVDVLREALARDEQAQSKERGLPLTKSEAARRVNSFIQNIHHTRDANLRTTDAPIERVAVFDEAQRAWDKERAANFMAQRKGVPNFNQSEPEFLISVMDRHKGWCVIVCLIGGGQEINSGEAGLTEWFSALNRKFPQWHIFTSHQLEHHDYHWGQDLSAMLEGLAVERRLELHLSVSIRSFRAEKLSEFVGELIAGNAANARAVYQQIQPSYPIFMTRNLSLARAWLRSRARGSERFGLVASSGASRLKPEGLNVHEEIDAVTWFLNDRTDVRSSFYLEDVATEFHTQGLELDWVGVCWDADYRMVDAHWSHHRFRGTTWQKVNDSFRRAYLANAYRVLMTRARQGMVIYVPPGAIDDYTRPPDFYDGVAAFLQDCGIEILAAN